MKCAGRGTPQPINYDNQYVGYRMRGIRQRMYFFAGSLRARIRATLPRCTLAQTGDPAQAKCAVKQLDYLHRACGEEE